jgi:hypothetical protein
VNTGQIRFLFKDFTIIDKPGDKSSTLAVEASFTVLQIKESIGSIMMKCHDKQYVSWVATDVAISASNIPLLIEGAQPYSVFRRVVEKVQLSPYMKSVFVLLITIRQDSVDTYSNHTSKICRSPNRASLPTLVGVGLNSRRLGQWHY